MINTDTKLNTPINRTELEEIIINNLQKNCSDSICHALENLSYNLDSKQFSFCIKEDQLSLIDGPRGRYDDDNDERNENYYNTYTFSFDLVSYNVTSDNVKCFVKDILADYVENLSLLGLINLSTHTYACPVNAMQAFVFNLFLTKSVFVSGKYKAHYNTYVSIITYILRKYRHDFVKFTLINVKHYSSIWKNNPKIVPNIIMILANFYDDKLSPEFQTLWVELIKQNSDYSLDGKNVITDGLLMYTNIPCIADFSLFYNFAKKTVNNKKIAKKYAITFKVYSVNSLTQFVNDLLNNQTPTSLKNILLITNKLVENGVQFDIDNRSNEKLNALIKQTDVQDINSLMLINQILKVIANQ